MKIFILDKKEKSFWLPRMFDLMYENMKDIAPSGLEYGEGRAEFLSNVSPALEKGPRQVLLAVEDGALLGYLQYYTRDDLLMVEEAQIRKDHQNTLLFLGLCRALLKLLPAEIRVVEAYADPRNSKSRRLMARLGMEEVPESGAFIHLRGSARKIWKHFHQ